MIELQANVDNVKRERDELEKEKLLLTERFNEDPDLKKSENTIITHLLVYINLQT